MCRRAVVVLIVALGLAGGVCPAQVQPGEIYSTPGYGPSGTPDDAWRNVPGESVVELADFVSGCLADAGTVPDYAQVRSADGRPRRISGAEIFILLARTVHLWQVTGQLPTTVPLTPDAVRAPVIDPEDLPESTADFSTGREIPTHQFLAQCAEAVRWVDRLHIVPTAVWVEGNRLSAAEYLGGLTICIQYAYYEGALQDSLLLPRYAPPNTWVARVTRVSSMASPSPPAPAEHEAGAAPQPTTFEQVQPEEDAPPVTYPSGALEGPALEPVTRPQLMLFPEPGAELRGKVDLVASYRGPSARFVIFAIDGLNRAIINYPPYSLRWDTSAACPGKHTVRVTVLGDEDAVLMDQVSAFTVQPEAEQEAESAPDDL
jgi:hypothetical protein